MKSTADLFLSKIFKIRQKMKKFWTRVFSPDSAKMRLNLEASLDQSSRRESSGRAGRNFRPIRVEFLKAEPIKNELTYFWLQSLDGTRQIFLSNRHLTKTCILSLNFKNIRSIFFKVGSFFTGFLFFQSWTHFCSLWIHFVHFLPKCNS